MLSGLIFLAEMGWVPDGLIRLGIQRLCSKRLKELALIPDGIEKHIAILKNSPLAVEVDSANQQHYEIPAEFFQVILGPNLKYSCGYWSSKTTTLSESEEASLQIVVDRAQIEPGMKILELGCGWGALSLFIAKKFPESQVVSISNSRSQKKFIESRAQAERIRNLQILTCDVAKLEGLEKTHGLFDRVISIEMFEHFLNYEKLLERIHSWTSDNGKLFAHVFSNKTHAYLFETEGGHNWMGKYFFTGGQMPSHSLLPSFDQHFTAEKTWIWDGSHYQKTSEAWLKNLDYHKTDVKRILAQLYGANESKRWLGRWRIFFLAVSGLFGFDSGTQWGVSHYLFSKKTKQQREEMC